MSSNVCANQNSFDNAFQQAVKYTEKKNRPKPWVQVVYLVLLLVFIVWAVMLALRVSPSERKLHLVFAMLFSPVYIIAHYLNQA